MWPSDNSIQTPRKMRRACNRRGLQVLFFLNLLSASATTLANGSHTVEIQLAYDSNVGFGRAERDVRSDNYLQTRYQYSQTKTLGLSQRLTFDASLTQKLYEVYDALSEVVAEVAVTHSKKFGLGQGWNKPTLSSSIHAARHQVAYSFRTGWSYGLQAQLGTQINDRTSTQLSLGYQGFEPDHLYNVEGTQAVRGDAWRWQRTQADIGVEYALNSRDFVSALVTYWNGDLTFTAHASAATVATSLATAPDHAVGEQSYVYRRRGDAIKIESQAVRQLDRDTHIWVGISRLVGESNSGISYDRNQLSIGMRRLL